MGEGPGENHILQKMNEARRIILFDGYCNFCSRSVMFIIRRDRHVRFVFAASQSNAGRRILSEKGIAEMASHSILLIENDRIYRKSGAALRIARRLGGVWPLFWICIVIPAGIRDFFYDLLAGNRYRLFGTRDSCFLPGRDIKDRFLQP